MAFICFFLTFASVAGADFSAQGSYAPIRAADFDVIAANMRRGPDLSRNLPAAPPASIDVDRQIFDILNWQKCASRRLIGVFASSMVNE